MDQDSQPGVTPADDCCSLLTDVEEKTKQQQLSSANHRPLLILLGILACAVGYTLSTTTADNTIIPAVEKNSICVSGGGFSGFWFTLGRLESLTEEDADTNTFYCYSAGCLGVVSRMKNHSVEEMYAMASHSQVMWKQGNITRYEVVQHFVDQLLPAETTTTTKRFLSRLNILTTVSDENSSFWGVRTSVRTPTSIESLRTMLVQTAWIPFATGKGLWHMDHMDGAFSIPQHPNCERHVGLIPDLDLMANVINVNLGSAAVQRLWKRGIQYGI